MFGTGEVRFPQHKTPICAAITLDKPNFHAEYDEGKHIWTAKWKWSGNQPAVSLKNRLSEYPTPKQLQGEYEQELQAWIQNGWLIPYPGDEFGPLKWRLCRRTNKMFFSSWIIVNLMSMLMCIRFVQTFVRTN